MKAVLVDTGCIVALLDRSERHHEHCVEVVTDLSGPLVTCEAVIAKSCYLLRSLNRAAAAILDNIERGVFQLPFRLDASGTAVKNLLRHYRNVPMDLADACLVQMADELDTGEILTLDSDFEVYRWRRKRKFHNLLTVLS